MARGEVRYRLTADTTAFEAAFGRAAKEVEAFGKALMSGAGLGAGFSIGEKAADAFTDAVKSAATAVTDAVKGLVAHADAMDDIRAKTGLTFKAQQEWAAGLKLTGTSAETVASLMGKLQVNLVKGGEAFEALHLNVKKLRDQAPEKMFAEVAERIRSLPTDAERTAAAIALMGKSGAEGLKLIKFGLQESSEEAQHFGMVMSEQTIKAAADLADEADRQGLSWDALKNNLASVITDNKDVQEAFKAVTEVIASASRFVLEHKDALGVLLGEVVNLGKNVGGLLVTAFNGFRIAMDELRSGSFGWFVEKMLALGGAGGDIDRIVQRIQRANREAALHMSISAGPGPGEPGGPPLPAGQIPPLRFSPGGGGKKAKPIDTLRSGPNYWLAAMMADQGRGGMGAVQSLGPTGNAGAIAMQQAMLGNWGGIADAATKTTKDWSKALGDVAHAFQVLGVSASSTLGRIVGGISAGGAALQQWTKGGGFKGLFGGKGGFEGVLGQITSGLGLVGSAFNIGKAIFGGLFGGGKRREEERKKREEEAKKAAEEAKQRRSEGIEQAGTGLIAGIAGIRATTEETARNQGILFAGQFWLTFKEKGLVGAIDAFKETFDKLKSSGFDVSGVLGAVGNLFTAASSELFKGAAEGAAGFAQLIAGRIKAEMPLAIGEFNAVSQQATAAFQQAMAGAADAGLSGTAQQSAAMAAVAPLLQQIITASQQYGFTIDANTQALIDQAKAAGIAFPVGPLDRIADVLERIYQLLGGTTQRAGELGNALSSLPAGGAGVLPGEMPGSPMPVQAATGYGPAVVPNLGRGLGPRIQTHAGEGVLVIPANKMGRGSARSMPRLFGAAEGFASPRQRGPGGDFGGVGGGTAGGGFGGGGGGGSSPTDTGGGGGAVFSGSPAGSAISQVIQEANAPLVAAVAKLASQPASVTLAPAISVGVDLSQVRQNREDLKSEIEDQVAAGVRTGMSPIINALEQQGFRRSA